MTATKPRIWAEHPSLDALTPLPAVQVPASALKPGMVLLDPDFMTPGASLDHKVRSARNSGQVSFLAFDYDRHNFDTVALTASTLVWVAA